MYGSCNARQIGIPSVVATCGVRAVHRPCKQSAWLMTQHAECESRSRPAQGSNQGPAVQADPVSHLPRWSCFFMCLYRRPYRATTYPSCMQAVPHRVVVMRLPSNGLSSLSSSQQNGFAHGTSLRLARHGRQVDVRDVKSAWEQHLRS